MQSPQVSKSSSTKNRTHKNSTPQAKLLVIDRKFNVSLEQLFEAFTDAEDIKAWWWPEDLYADKVDWDFAEGGTFFINMKGGEHGGGGMTGEFEEIVEDERIVMTDQFSDEEGNPISAKEANMIGAWPDMVYITFEFTSISEDSSRLTMSQEGIPNELQKECTQGWNQSFDKLEKYLNEQ